MATFLTRINLKPGTRTTRRNTFNADYFETEIESNQIDVYCLSKVTLKEGEVMLVTSPAESTLKISSSIAADPYMTDATLIHVAHSVENMAVASDGAPASSNTALNTTLLPPFGPCPSSPVGYSLIRGITGKYPIRKPALVIANLHVLGEIPRWGPEMAG